MVEPVAKAKQSGEKGSAVLPHIRLGDRSNFMGVPVHHYDLEETCEIADMAMRTGRRVQQVDINVYKMIELRGDRKLARAVEASDLVSVDGMGVLVGCKLLKVPVRGRVAGVDLMEAIFALCAREGYRPFLFGARQDILEEAVRKVQRDHPGLEIAGRRNGYFKPEDEEGIVADIKRSGADCLFVGIASPIKEDFLFKYRDQLDVPYTMGVGGAFDVLAGKVTRAPDWMQQAGLEWLHRLLMEPGRLWRRYLTSNSKYAVMLTAALARKYLRSS
ncbi:MAG: WecB/TagA/CpsF family glycosyltransferase [Hyphomicrobiaceae bacterium]|nr:WecB/TagA/CpsF family glycosyltransferase [Hyphomicrobiaceae bacterium]